MSALAQLLDMGIPRGRAVAALKRAKDDAMVAAERVFAGEFDDVPSDDDGDDDGGGRPASNGLLTPGESVRASEDTTSCPISRGVQDVLLSDDAPSDDDDGDIEFDDFLDDDQVPPMMQDPYANVFFSKDRVERLVEPIPEEIYAEVDVPLGHPDIAKDGPKKLRLKVLGRAEWMSGCPEGHEQSFLFQSYNSLAEGSMSCASRCGHQFPRDPKHFFSLFPTFPAYVSHLASIIQKSCPKCKHVTCFACGEPTRPLTKSKGKQIRGDEITESLFHCPAIQGVILGVGLHMTDQAFISNDKSKSSPDKSKKRKLAQAELDGLMNIGRKLVSKAQGKGTGYSGDSSEDRSGQQAAEKEQARKDAATAALLSQVALYLPNVKRSQTFTSDLMVHPTALAHLRRHSGFVNDLLRNDSLLDMTQRDSIYRALLDWLEIVANHEALAAMLAMPQMRPMHTEPGPDNGTVTVTYEVRPSPRELLENIVIQATAALKGLASTGIEQVVVLDPLDKKPDPKEKMSALHVSSVDVDDDVHNGALKTFCERILSARDNIDQHLVNSRGQDFVDRMHAEMHNSGGVADGEVTAAESEEDTIKIYEDWAKRTAFAYCDLTDPVDPKAYRHAMSPSIVALVGQDVPKRSLAIAKELGVLSTNIPTAWNSSIFLRVDHDRVDTIKAMIIGPKDTPYENGCFLFDIFLPLEYNQCCPKVKSMTTNGGRYRYNPNLYADGKVCLSLLGTWSGPGWISGKSTLLQVLISIQSLILCEEPYLNEPGWASQGGSPASKAYSANVRRMVLHDAMANNIRNPPYPFENEIRTHFKLMANSIRAQLDRWKKLDNDKPIQGETYNLPPAVAAPSSAAGTSGSQTPFDKHANELRKLLDELSPPPKPTAAVPAAVRRNPPRRQKK